MENQVVSKETEDHRIKEFKSLYYELNAKPDSTTKIYNDKVIVYKDDIDRLCELINEKLSFHVKENEVGTTNVVVSTSKHKAYSFNDYKIFSVFNWSIPEYINSITVSWDFFVNVEGYSRPQRHKLTVKISCGLKPEEILGLLFSGRIEDIQEIEAQEATIIAQMDFIENRLGQEFINIVGEWVGTLLKAYTEKNRIILFFKKYRKLVGYYFNYVLFIILTATSLIGLNYLIDSFNIDLMMDVSSDQLKFLINYVVICFLLCCFTLDRGESVANKVFKYLSGYGETFVFRITKGDENEYNKVISNDKRSATKIFVNLIISLILNVGCGIMATLLYNKL